MGFFRRYKLTDYTADECRKEMDRLALSARSIHVDNRHSMEQVMETWACFRELLARHEKKNES